MEDDMEFTSILLQKVAELFKGSDQQRHSNVWLTMTHSDPNVYGYPSVFCCISGGWDFFITLTTRFVILTQFHV